MKIFVHDLSEQEFVQAAEDTMIIGDDGTIKSCIGCFGCWIKTPGVCVLNDGCQHLGQLLAKCTELVIISKCVYGSYSPFIRNVWDRGISYLLPYFERKHKETHHKIRYNKRFALKVHFYGSDITAQEKETAEMLVKANAANYGTQAQIFFHHDITQIQEALS